MCKMSRSKEISKEMPVKEIFCLPQKNLVRVCCFPLQ